MRHKFEVVHDVLVLFGWILFELFKFYVKNVPVSLELGLVLVTLTLYLVLELGECVSLLVFVKSK